MHSEASEPGVNYRWSNRICVERLSTLRPSDRAWRPHQTSPSLYRWWNIRSLHLQSPVANLDPALSLPFTHHHHCILSTCTCTCTRHASRHFQGLCDIWLEFWLCRIFACLVNSHKDWAELVLMIEKLKIKQCGIHIFFVKVWNLYISVITGTSFSNSFYHWSLLPKTFYFSSFFICWLHFEAWPLSKGLDEQREEQLRQGGRRGKNENV